MSPEVLVIGGGFAGLRTAVTLADAGFKVTVVERHSTLGGRARSFLDPATGEVVDNGQHLFLAGYRSTIRFLERLGTQDKLIFQDRLKVTFVEAGGRVSTLDCPKKLPAPWHLLVGVGRLSTLSLLDKVRFRKVSHALTSFSGNGTRGQALDQETVDQWLTRLGQSTRSRTLFWDPLAIATLNESPLRASALGLAAVLRTILVGTPSEARLGMARVGLSDLYATPAQRIIEERGGRLLLNCSVAGLTVDSSNKVSVLLANGSTLTAGWVVSAVPPTVLSRILPASAHQADPGLSELGRFTTSPIISINLWLDHPVTEELFVGLIGTRVQWLFNKAAILAQAGIEAHYITLILSAASSFMEEPNEKLVSMAMEDLKSCFPKAKEARLLRSQVVREQDATVSLTVGMEKYRPGPKTPFQNLFLAGDWTATGLPATIESAVVSGEVAAQTVLQSI